MPDKAPTLDELTKLGHRDDRKPCKVAAAVAGLTAAEQKVVLEGLASDNEDTRRGAMAWLAAEPRNITFSTSALGSHRGKTCKCHPRD